MAATDLPDFDIAVQKAMRYDGKFLHPSELVTLRGLISRWWMPSAPAAPHGATPISRSPWKPSNG